MTDGEKKGLSTGAKWGIGCGIGCLSLVIVTIVVGVLAYFFVMGKVREVTQDLTTKGFEKQVKGQTIEVREDITEPTLYVGQMVKIFGTCKTNLAIVAQLAEIHGKVEGKVYFRGQLLTIQPTAEILGGLDVTAQAVLNKGKVEGGISGQYQTMQNQ